MSTQFANYAFAATGEPATRTMPDRLSDIKNVKDFGAIGDGVTDDLAAIMAAFNWTAGQNRGTVFFPPGTYYVSQPIDFSMELSFVEFCGVGALSKVIGNFPDYVFKRGESSTNGYSGGHIIRDLWIENANPAGGGIRMGLCVGGAIRNCIITANLGINTASDDTLAGVTSLEISIENCTLSPGTNAVGSTGILSVADGPILNCIMTGFAVGMKLWGNEGSMAVMGCRFDLCGIGLDVGDRPDGSSPGTGCQVVSGCLFKNCGTGIYKGGFYCRFIGIRVEGATGTIAGDPQYGIHLPANDQTSGTFEGIIVAGEFAQAGIALDGGETYAQQTTFVGVQSINTGAGQNWKLPSTAATAQFIGCNVAPVFTMAGLPSQTGNISAATYDPATGTVTITAAISLPGVQFANITVSGMNSPGYNRSVTGATVVAFNKITYPVTSNPGTYLSGGSVTATSFSATGLPSAQEGDSYNVSNSPSSAWGAIVTTGTGTTHAKLRWNGTNWVVLGK